MAKKDDCLLKTGMTEAETKAAFPNGIPTGDEAKQFINNRRAFAQMSRKQKALEISAAMNVQRYLDNYREKGGNLTDAVAAIISRDEGEIGGIVNMESRSRAINNYLHGMMAQSISKLESKFGGFKRDEKLANDMVYEVLGGDSKNPIARDMAQEWKSMSDYAVNRMNNAGTNISKIDNWIPQSHSGNKLRHAGSSTKSRFVNGKRIDSNVDNIKPKDLNEARRNWKSFISARIDVNKMIDDATDLPMTPEKLDEFLTGTFNKIVSNDLSGSSGILANRFGRERSIIFKDADSWMEYQHQFGSDDTWGVMVDHMRRTSNDISAMETLGPDPDGMMDKLLSEAKQDATANNKNAQIIKSATIKQAYRDMRQTASPENPHMQKPFQLGRQIALAAVLPATAPITAFTTDIASAAIANAYAGLPVVRAIGAQLKQIWENGKSAKLGGKAARDYLIQIGASFDTAIDSSISAHRFAGDVGEFGSKYGNFAMRVSGMNAATMGQRAAWAENTLFKLWDVKALGTTYDKLSPKMRAMFERNSITEADWNVVLKEGKGATPPNSNKVKHLDIQKLPPEQNTKIGAMIATEMEIAVPIPNHINRARTALNTEAGTLGGEVVRTGMQFLSTPVTSTFNQITRMMNGNAVQHMGGKLGYTGAFIGGMTIAGYFALMVTDMTKGREPREFGGDNTAEQDALLLWDSMTKGGANLLMGDIVNVTFGRYGRSEAAVLPSGAAVEVIFNDILGTMVIDNIKQMAKGEDTEVVSDAAKLIENVPLINTWYAKEAVNRGLTAMLEAAGQDEYSRKIREQDRRRIRELNQGLWLER